MRAGHQPGRRRGRATAAPACRRCGPVASRGGGEESGATAASSGPGRGVPRTPSKSRESRARACARDMSPARGVEQLEKHGVGAALDMKGVSRQGDERCARRSGAFQEQEDQQQALMMSLRGGRCVTLRVGKEKDRSRQLEERRVSSKGERVARAHACMHARTQRHAHARPHTLPRTNARMGGKRLPFGLTALRKLEVSLPCEL